MPASRSAVAGPTEADERYRALALEQLWRLRDSEILHAGHSSPAYIAARIANELGYPQPPRPRSKHVLDMEASRPISTRTPRRASWCDPDRQIVTGQHRAELLQWLPEVVGLRTTAKQMAVLDGITARTSLTYVRELLASEGFEQVADVYGNAGPAPQPRALYDYVPVHEQARIDAATVPPAPTGTTVANRVALVLCARTDGFLATVHASAFDSAVRVQNVSVFYNVMILDQDAFWAGVTGTHHLATDDDGALTTIQAGAISTMPVYPGGGSLRVGLAALRAFARPVAPWYDHPAVHYFAEGSGVTDRAEEILVGLPAWVHDLLGPRLISWDPGGSARAA